MMKKSLVILLVLILAISLTACDNDNDNGNSNRGSTGNDAGGVTSNESARRREQPEATPDVVDLITGTWAYTIDIGGFIQEEIGNELAELGDEFAGFFDNLPGNAMLTLLFEFNADGTYRMYADEDGLYAIISNTLENIITAVYVFLDSMFEEMAAEMGMSIDELIAAFEAEEGVLFSDFMDMVIEEMIAEMGDLNDIFGEFADSGRFKIEGDRLFVASDGEDFEHYEVFEISGNTLTILSTSDPTFDPDEFGGFFSYPARLTKR